MLHERQYFPTEVFHMNALKFAPGLLAALLLMSGFAQAHEGEAKGQLGRVSFANSCSASGAILA